MLGGYIRTVWSSSMLGHILLHEGGDPHVHNALGGVLEPFALPIPW